MHDRLQDAGRARDAQVERFVEKLRDVAAASEAAAAAAARLAHTSAAIVAGDTSQRAASLAGASLSSRQSPPPPPPPPPPRRPFIGYAATPEWRHLPSFVSHAPRVLLFAALKPPAAPTVAATTSPAQPAAYGVKFSGSPGAWRAQVVSGSASAPVEDAPETAMAVRARVKFSGSPGAWRAHVVLVPPVPVEDVVEAPMAVHAIAAGEVHDELRQQAAARVQAVERGRRARGRAKVSMLPPAVL